MVQRSVPFYGEIQRMVVEVAALRLRPGGVFFDIGCSTGTTIRSLAEEAPDPSIRMVGIDPSDAMIARASEKLAPLGDRVRLVNASLQDFDTLEGAQVVTMLYTLQFIRPIARLNALKMIRNSLPGDGCFILAEKILADTRMATRMYIDLYHRYKKRSGYSDLEIAKKRDALENVLVPFRNRENLELLSEAGFSQVEQAFRWYNFALYIAAP
jgi:tRNA (cmo5U34)-methyltransferase